MMFKDYMRYIFAISFLKFKRVFLKLEKIVFISLQKLFFVLEIFKF